VLRHQCPSQIVICVCVAYAEVRGVGSEAINILNDILEVLMNEILRQLILSCGTERSQPDDNVHMYSNH
jgi:hypothetical protein